MSEKQESKQEVKEEPTQDAAKATAENRDERMWAMFCHLRVLPDLFFRSEILLHLLLSG